MIRQLKALITDVLFIRVKGGLGKAKEGPLGSQSGLKLLKIPFPPLPTIPTIPLAAPYDPYDPFNGPFWKMFLL